MFRKYPVLPPKGRVNLFLSFREGSQSCSCLHCPKEEEFQLAAEAVACKVMGSLTVFPRVTVHLLRMAMLRNFPTGSFAVSTHRGRVGITYTQNMLGLILWCWGGAQGLEYAA